MHAREGRVSNDYTCTSITCSHWEHFHYWHEQFSQAFAIRYTRATSAPEARGVSYGPMINHLGVLGWSSFAANFFCDPGGDFGGDFVGDFVGDLVGDFGEDFGGDFGGDRALEERLSGDRCRGTVAVVWLRTSSLRSDL